MAEAGVFIRVAASWAVCVQMWASSEARSEHLLLHEGHLRRLFCRVHIRGCGPACQSPCGTQRRGLPVCQRQGSAGHRRPYRRVPRAVCRARDGSVCASWPDQRQSAPQNNWQGSCRPLHGAAVVFILICIAIPAYRLTEALMASISAKR